MHGFSARRLIRTRSADVAIHPNQGEIISCDQAGSVKIWDLAANSCTHELVRFSSYPNLASDVDLAVRSCLRRTCRSAASVSPATVVHWCRGTITLVSFDCFGLASCDKPETMRLLGKRVHVEHIIRARLHGSASTGPIFSPQSVLLEGPSQSRHQVGHLFTHSPFLKRPADARAGRQAARHVLG